MDFSEYEIGIAQALWGKHRILGNYPGFVRVVTKHAPSSETGR